MTHPRTQPQALHALRQGDLDHAGLVDFLLARIAEESRAARGRLARTTGESAALARRGVELLDELAADLTAGRSIDQMSLDLLLAAHGRHPDFRRSWDRFAA